MFLFPRLKFRSANMEAICTCRLLGVHAMPDSAQVCCTVVVICCTHAPGFGCFHTRSAVDIKPSTYSHIPIHPHGIHTLEIAPSASATCRKPPALGQQRQRQSSHEQLHVTRSIRLLFEERNTVLHTCKSALSDHALTTSMPCDVVV